MAPSNHNFAIISSLIFAGVLSRLAPHPLNMALVTGATIYGATKLTRRDTLIVPLAIMFVTDAVLGFHTTMLFTWGAFALIAVLAHAVLSGKTTLTRVAATTLSSSVIFFVISNLGVWLTGHMYTLDLAGFVACYVNALPFFQNTLIGDALYTASVFGLGYLSSLNIFHLKSSATL